MSGRNLEMPERLVTDMRPAATTSVNLQEYLRNRGKRVTAS